MVDDETSVEKKDSIKKELIQEIRAISKDDAVKRRIEEGIFGGAEIVKGSILAVLVRALDNLEQKLDSEFVKTAQFKELETHVRSDLQVMKNSLKELNIRIIETMSKNFEMQKHAIDAIPLPLERAIIEIPKGLKAEVQEIKDTSEKLAKDLAEVNKLNLDLRKSLDDMHTTMKDFSDGLRQFHETLDLQKSRIDEMSQMVQSKIDKISITVDEKTITLAEKMQQSLEKMGSFETWMVAFSSSVDGMDAKFTDINKRVDEIQSKLSEKIADIETYLKDGNAIQKAGNEEMMKKLDVLATTIIGIEALDEFVKSIEKKIDGTKVDLTSLEKNIEEIKMNLDFETILNSIKEMQAKFDSQANMAASLLMGENAKIDTAPIEKAIDKIREEMKELNNKHSRSLSDIQVKINALSRALEMKE